MTAAERNAVIDECIALVRGYDERVHKLAVLRQHLRRNNGPQIPTSAQGMIVVGLQGLKDVEPRMIEVIAIRTDPR